MKFLTVLPSVISLPVASHSTVLWNVWESGRKFPVDRTKSMQMEAGAITAP